MRKDNIQKMFKNCSYWKGLNIFEVRIWKTGAIRKPIIKQNPFTGSSIVADLSPYISTRAGPIIVSIPRSANPTRLMNIIRANECSLKKPNRPDINPNPATIAIVEIFPSFCARNPHRKVPSILHTVLMTIIVAKKWSSLKMGR